MAGRDGRVVECGCLENNCPFTGTVGSNPTLSAIFVYIILFMVQKIKKLSKTIYNVVIVFVLFTFANTLLFASASTKLPSDFIKINNKVFLDNTSHQDKASLDYWSVVVVDDKTNDDIKNVVIEYTVVPWDTLSSIATKYWTTVSNIMKVNNLTSTTVRPWKRLYITPVEGFIITLDKVTNPMVFANIYWLNLEDLMTTNWITDKLQLLPKWDDLFIPISREKWIELGLLEAPKPIIQKPKTIKTNTIVVKKTYSKKSSYISNPRYVSNSMVAEPTYSNTKIRKPHIIAKWSYTAPVSNWFFKWQCTWYVAINADWAFPYINKNRQFKSWRWDAKQRFANARNAWFITSSRPSVWAIMVIGWWRYWHVTIVKQVDRKNHRILVQWMNYLRPYVVTKRWIYMDKTMTKVVANSKYVIWFIPKQKTPQRILDKIQSLKN